MANKQNKYKEIQYAIMIAVVLIQNTDSQHFTALSTFTFHTASEFSDITYLHTLTYSV